jgi:hypothetical protein
MLVNLMVEHAFSTKDALKWDCNKYFAVNKAMLLCGGITVTSIGQNYVQFISNSS